MLIIEGADATGKSTLARIIARELSLNLIEGEGPPKDDEDLSERIERYKRIPNAVFVRHPVISQPIYGKLRGDFAIPPHVIKEFYDGNHFFIYCDPVNLNIANHEIKPYEDPEHVKLVENRYEFLVNSYRHWALNKAHVIYRIGDDPITVVKICATLMQRIV